MGKKTELEEFQELLTKEGIKYFSPKEVFYLGGLNETIKVNSIPPKRLWNNIITTLRVLDKARERAGPLRLTSIYRNDAYNKAVGGERNSFHKQFIAADVIPLRCSVEALYNIIIDLRKAGEFKGGVGKYDAFVHVDTRGWNADW